MNRDEAITRIRKALKNRSAKSWSVTGGRGTDWGWLTIQAPPSRRETACDYMTAEDCRELGELLGHHDATSRQGEDVSPDEYVEYVRRAEGMRVDAAC